MDRQLSPTVEALRSAYAGVQAASLGRLAEQAQHKEGPERETWSPLGVKDGSGPRLQSPNMWAPWEAFLSKAVQNRENKMKHQS